MWIAKLIDNIILLNVHTTTTIIYLFILIHIVQFVIPLKHIHIFSKIKKPFGKALLVTQCWNVSHHQGLLA
jgi:hypothetical protein